jgi:hypothetical protein
VSLRIEAPDVRVFVGGVESPNVHCLNATLGAGAQTLPRALLEIQPPTRHTGRRRLLDMEFASFNQAEVEVMVGGQVVHWGKALAQAVNLDESGDVVRVVSRMDEHHFGRQLYRTFFYDPLTRETVGHALPTVFNPDWDGRTVGNMSTQRDKANKSSLFEHESIETLPAFSFHGSVPQYWTLPEAVYYLCFALNTAQKYVLNPTLAELKALLPASPAMLRNHECRVGEYLPALLDEILAPFGYGWTVTYLSRGRRKLRFFQRSASPPNDLHLQTPGATLNMKNSNLERMAMTADAANRSFNAVTVFGDHVQIESTFELVKGWEDDLDTTEHGDLTKNEEGWFDNPERRNVWRNWVLNEAGDYNKTRPEIKKAYDLSALAHPYPYLPRRRKFESAITLDSDKSPKGNAGGIYVEWWDNQFTEGADGVETQVGWRPIEDLGPESRQVRVLERECGIFFDGVEIPYEIVAQGANAKVRVTATIELDYRAEVQVTRWPASLLKDLKEEIFDCATKFKVRKRHFTSRWVGSGLETSEVDNTADMRVFANQLLDGWNLATIDGTFTLTGVEFDYLSVIGSTISGISGRGVGFNVSPRGGHWPTVVGAVIRFDQQCVDFTVDTFRESGEVGAAGRRREERV